jgi:predicted lipoprotein with Yx(FWY)xxD motif
MRRLFAAAVAVVALGAMLAACGDDDDSSSSDTTTTEASDGSTTTAPAADATVAVAVADVGDVLVDAEGRSLYLFTNDEGTTSSCTGGCADTWPPLTVDGEATAGDRVDQA